MQSKNLLEKVFSGWDNLPLCGLVQPANQADAVSQRNEMRFRKYFVGVIVVSLLIWGPINHSWSGWLVIRIGYLILIPTLLWYLLSWIWNKWQPNSKTENILERSFAGIVSCILLFLAIFKAKATFHLDNTMWIQTRDGMEAVGEDIIVPGADWSTVIIFGLAAIFVFWLGVIKNNSKNYG